MEKKKRHSILKRVMAIALSLMLALTGFQLTGLRAQAAENYYLYINGDSNDRINLREQGRILKEGDKISLGGDLKTLNISYNEPGGTYLYDGQGNAIRDRVTAPALATVRGVPNKFWKVGNFYPNGLDYCELALCQIDSTPVTLDNQGATPATTNVDAASGAAMPKITPPAKNGYTFGGYWTGTNGGGTQIYKPNGTSDKNYDGSFIKLYAKWTANTYTVNYIGNKPTSASSDVSGSTASSSHTYGTAKNLTPNGFSLTGWSFDGWTTNENGSGTSYADKANVTNLTATQNGTFNLYAQWKANTYNVKYEKNQPTAAEGSVSGEMNNSSHTYDTAQNLTSNAYRLDGWTFMVWNTNADGTGTSYADGASVNNLTSTNGDTVSLYAIWKIQAAIENAPTAKTDLKYTGTPQPLVNAGSIAAPEHSKVQYSLNANGPWSYEVPSVSDAGRYKVYYQAVHTDDDYADGPVSVTPVEVTIEKAPVTVTPVSGQKKEYDEADPEFTYTADGLVNEESSENAFTGKLGRDSGSDVGKYKITQGDLAAKNYEITFVDTVEFEIIPKSAPTDILDSQKPTATDPPLDANGAVLIYAPQRALPGYTIKYSLDGENWSNELPKATEKGPHKVYYHYENDANHAPLNTIFELISTVTVAATVDGVDYGTLDKAVSAWNTSGGTLKLLQDAKAASTLSLTGTEGKTLDLNGKTLTGPAYGALFDLSANGSLTIKDEATGGNIKTTDTAVKAGSRATVTLESGTVESTGGKAFDVADDTNVKLLGGSVKTADDQNAIDKGNITLGGEIKLDGGGILLPFGNQIHLGDGFDPASPVKLSVAEGHDGYFLADDSTAPFTNNNYTELEKCFAPAESGKGLDFENSKPILKPCTTYGGITVNGKPLNNLNIKRLLGIDPAQADWNVGTTTLTINTDKEIESGKEIYVPSGVTLRIPSGNTLTNKGTITGDGKVKVEGTLDNKGTIAAPVDIPSGGTLNNENGGTLSGDVSNQTGGKLNNQTGGKITGDVTNDGDFTNKGNISGKVTNNAGGKLDNNAGGNITGDVNNSGSFNNGGTVKGTGTVKNSGSGAVLTNTGNIEGSVNVDNENSGKIVNDGSINTSGTVKNGTGSTIENSAGKTIGSAITNDGTIENAGTLSGNVSNNGTINNTGELSGNTTNNASGTINNNSGGDIPGKLKNETGGTVKNNNGATISGELENAGTLDNDGTISSAKVSNSGRLTNDGSITGRGTVENSGNLTNNGTLDNTGGVNNTGTLTNNADKTIATPVNNSAGGTVENNGTLSGAVTNSGNGSTINNEITGTISGKLTNSDKGIINNKGTISGDLTSSGAGSNVNNALGGKLTGNVTNNTGSTFNNNGEINGNEKTLNNSGTLVNASGTEISVPVKNTNGGIVNNEGTISGDLTNTGYGSTVNNSGASLSGKVTNGNGGIINNKADITGAVTNQAGAVIDNSFGGTISGELNNSGTLIEKNGNNGAVTVNNSGTVSVITPPAGKTVTVSDGKVTLPAGSTIETTKAGGEPVTTVLPAHENTTYTVPSGKITQVSVDAENTTSLPV